MHISVFYYYLDPCIARVGARQRRFDFTSISNARPGQPRVHPCWPDAGAHAVQGHAVSAKGARELSAGCER